MIIVVGNQTKIFCRKAINPQKEIYYFPIGVYFLIMKEISLTQGKFALVDDEDFEELNKFKWNTEKRGRTFYARRGEGEMISRKKIYMHRQIMNTTDHKIQVDHKDGDGLNNQRNNLRPCTGSENLMNQRPRIGGTSIYKGVHWNNEKRKWQSRIVINKIHIHIGYFINEIEAATSYNLKATESFGEFARLNTF